MKREHRNRKENNDKNNENPTLTKRRNERNINCFGSTKEYETDAKQSCTVSFIRIVTRASEGVTLIIPGIFLILEHILGEHEQSLVSTRSEVNCRIGLSPFFASNRFYFFVGIHRGSICVTINNASEIIERCQ